jgi:lipopolysaccharide export system ATP-binding protein
VKSRRGQDGGTDSKDGSKSKAVKTASVRPAASRASGPDSAQGIRGSARVGRRTVRGVLEARNLVKAYRGRRVVDDVCIQVREGEIVGLLGPNGAGKTTTFYMITGMIRPNAGRIYHNRTDITGLPMYRRARLGIGYLSQEPSIFRKLSVEENILAILETLPIERPERMRRLEVLLNELSIARLAKQKAYTLSGGERRRLEITRALVTSPKFILLDEPFAGIDPIAVEDIQNIVRLLKAKGIGILITDHNVHETLSITDRSYLLCEGRILKSGTSEFLASDEEARQIYLGKQFRLDRYSEIDSP